MGTFRTAMVLLVVALGATSTLARYLLVEVDDQYEEIGRPVPSAGPLLGPSFRARETEGKLYT